MRLGVISMIRNEADIVRAFSDHLAAFFDVAYLLDHRSADGTGELLQRAAAARNGWKYTRLEFSGYHQKEVSNFFMKKAFEEASVDFLFFLDADEFLSVPTRAELVDYLSHNLSRKALGKCSWRNCCPVDFTRIKFCLGDEVWMASNTSSFSKMIIPREVYAAFGHRLQVLQGNHGIEPLGEELPLVETCDLFHMPVRSFHQMTQKVVVGALSYLSKGGRLSTDGYHWFELLDRIAAGKIDEGSLIHLVANYGQPLGAEEARSFEELGELGFQRRLLQVASASIPKDLADPARDANGLQLIAASIREWSNEDARLGRLVLEGEEIRLLPAVASLPPLNLVENMSVPR